MQGLEKVVDLPLPTEWMPSLDANFLRDFSSVYILNLTNFLWFPKENPPRTLLYGHGDLGERRVFIVAPGERGKYLGFSTESFNAELKFDSQIVHNRYTVRIRVPGIIELDTHSSDNHYLIYQSFRSLRKMQEFERMPVSKFLSLRV